MSQIPKILLDLKAVQLRTDPPFTWTSGIKSPIYTDNRILMSHPQQRKQVIDAFTSLIEDNNIQFDAIAGTATAGIPWAAFIAQSLNKPMVYVRSKSKQHGKENKVEGTVQQDKTYLVVEDLISTGGSSINAANALRDAGAVVNDCVAIFTYGLKASSDNFKEHNLTLHTLTDFTQLLDIAVENNIIDNDQLELITTWKVDPQNWMK